LKNFVIVRINYHENNLIKTILINEAIINFSKKKQKIHSQKFYSTNKKINIIFSLTFIVVLFLSLISCNQIASTTVSGYVYEASSKDPIQGATLIIYDDLPGINFMGTPSPTKYTTTTDSTGWYKISFNGEDRKYYVLSSNIHYYHGENYEGTTLVYLRQGITHTVDFTMQAFNPVYLTGGITDKITNEALDSVKIYIYQRYDSDYSKILDSTITNSEGLFSVSYLQDYTSSMCFLKPKKDNYIYPSREFVPNSYYIYTDPGDTAEVYLELEPK